MAAAGEVSYLRRFAGKFVEIVAAGIGTAVSGYLVAYFTGHFSFFTPAAVRPTPPQTGWPADAARERIDRSHGSRCAGESRGERGSAAGRNRLLQHRPPASRRAGPPVLTSTASTSATAVAPPLATAEIKSLPVAAAADPPLPAEPDAWPHETAPPSPAEIWWVAAATAAPEQQPARPVQALLLKSSLPDLIRRGPRLHRRADAECGCGKGCGLDAGAIVKDSPAP